MTSFFQRLKGINQSGDSIKDILLYWLPELVSAAILVSLPPMIDSWIMSRLGSTTLYGAMAMGTNFLHTLIKLAESIPVAAIAVMGRHNGAQDYEKCGESLGDTFWTTVLFGLTQFSFILVAATSIYRWLNVPEEMVAHGAHFLQLRSFGVLLIFMCLGLLAFMRAVKNTRMPMLINLIGIAVFIFTDYSLVLGKFGMPRLELLGSALATTVQYAVMNTLALTYILTNPDYKKYFKHMFFSIFSIKRALHILNLSWPIMIDKMSIAMSYVWLSKMLAPMGAMAIVTYDVVKNLERFAFLPVMASAGIITFLVSNRLGAHDGEGAMGNIRKVFLLTYCTVIPALLILCVKAPFFISFFDPKNQFTAFASTVLPIISLLVILDFTQVVLAAALRGAGDVRTVMLTRLVCCFCFFVPVSWLLAQIPGISTTLRFTLVYGSFYITTGLIGLRFWYRIKSRRWQKEKI